MGRCGGDWSRSGPARVGEKKHCKKVENFRKPMLWDADALNLLAINPDKRHNRVITPHPGEAARLLGCSVAEIESDAYIAPNVWYNVMAA